MKTTIVVCACTALLAIAPALAQTANVPVPDTLGANFADTTGTATADAFDYLIGEWDFRFQTRREDGTFNVPRPGHWKAWKSHHGQFLVHIKYYDITANHFLWRADGSTDGGRTWTRDTWRMEATRTR